MERLWVRHNWMLLRRCQGLYLFSGGGHDSERGAADAERDVYAERHDELFDWNGERGAECAACDADDYADQLCEPGVHDVRGIFHGKPAFLCEFADGHDDVQRRDGANWDGDDHGRVGDVYNDCTAGRAALDYGDLFRR